MFQEQKNNVVSFMTPSVPVVCTSVSTSSRLLRGLVIRAQTGALHAAHGVQIVGDAPN